MPKCYLCGQHAERVKTLDKNDQKACRDCWSNAMHRARGLARAGKRYTPLAAGAYSARND